MPKEINNEPMEWRTLIRDENVSEEAIDLLKSMLDLDYRTRITADSALKHPFFDDIHDAEEIADIKAYE